MVTYLLYGLILYVSNGVPFFGCVMLPRALRLLLRILLSFLYTIITAYSVDERLDYLKHLVRDSYRQHLLSQAALRRHDCQGKTKPVHVKLTRSLYLSPTQPLHQTLLRQILTGSVDHTSRLFKSNLTNSPFCPFCNSIDETAKHIFWDCQRWHSIRTKYPQLLKLFHLVGSQWPNCLLHCGWIEQDCNYGLELLEGLQNLL